MHLDKSGSNQTTATAPNWSYGDRVVHAGKPEWGAGVISQALATMHEGRACQRLTIRFEHAGLKTISTAFAELRAAGQPTSENQAAVADDASDDESLRERLLGLPESARDPFSTPVARLRASIELFRFEKDGGSLLDWAAAQSGLRDPLSRFNRHQLEELFGRFCRTRDEHTRTLMEEMRRSDPKGLADAMSSSGPKLQRVLKRLSAHR